MPAVQAPAKILVTGASGFVAVWVVKKYLERGFHVRGTVRSASKGEYLAKIFSAEFPGKFEYVIVKDITEPGAFDEAVKGVDAIAHTASPVSFPDEPVDPSILIKPAVEGTLTVFKSAEKYGSLVKRIVVTGSVVSLLEPHAGPYTYTEDDWNNYAVAQVEANGKDAAGALKYVASKVLAEQAVWKFMKDHADSVSFDAVVVLPPWMYGPILQDASRLEDVNLSALRAYKFFTDEVPEDELAQSSGNFLDVRDAANFHVDATTHEELAGRRLVVANSAPAFQDFYDALNGLPAGSLPALPFTIPRGVPGAADATRNSFVTATTRTAAELGRTLKDLPETMRDMLVSFSERKLI